MVNSSEAGILTNLPLRTRLDERCSRCYLRKTLTFLLEFFCSEPVAMYLSHRQIGYCMNVHPATDLSTVNANLDQYASAVRQNLLASDVLSQEEALGIGLWLSEAVVKELEDPAKLSSLKTKLQALQLHPFTFNGFPQHNFHQAVVKHQVYLPTWWEPARLEYTKRLASIMAELLPNDAVGSISTLPIGWPTAQSDNSHLAVAANNLHLLAVHLDQLFQQTGKQIVLAIEPEPGCILGDSAATRAFFLNYLFKGKNKELHRQYLTVCHDICHAAVMREDQKLQIQAYRECGIRIGKVQVSSAIHVDWDQLQPAERIDAFQQVTAFAEDRYLHQTTTRTGPVGSIRLVEDLCNLVAEVQKPEQLVGNWTIHFHVPIHVESFGKLQTTRNDIVQAIEGLETVPSVP